MKTVTAAEVGCNEIEISVLHRGIVIESEKLRQIKEIRKIFGVILQY